LQKERKKKISSDINYSGKCIVNFFAAGVTRLQWLVFQPSYVIVVHWRYWDLGTLFRTLEIF